MAAGGGGRTLDTGPGADAAAPADDGVEHAGVVLDLRVLEHDALLDTGAGADDDSGSDADIGAELGRGVDVGSGVDEDGGNDVGAGRGELLAAGLPGLLQVERVGGDGRASRLDLAPKVLGLVHVELLAVGHVAENVLLEADDLLLVLVVVIVGHGAGHPEVVEVVRGRVRDEAGAVGAALDGGSDGGEDGVGGEEVDAAVDEVADVRLGLLDVVQHAAGVGVGDDAAKVGGGLVANAGSQDDGLGVTLHEELEHLLERERAAHVGVEDEEALGAAL